MKMHAYFLLAILVCVPAACGGETDNHPACLPELTTDCTPLYAPTFDNIYQNTLAPKCAVGGTSCHGKGADRMTLEGGPDLAYEELLNPQTGSPRVFPGDIACGHLLYHIESLDPEAVMPPGSPLSEKERCAIRQWIAHGAQRSEGETEEAGDEI